MTVMTLPDSSVRAEVAADLRTRITAGAWRDGNGLPCARETAAEYRCSYDTVRGAWRDLEEEGLLIAHPTTGVRYPAGCIPRPTKHAQVADMIRAHITRHRLPSGAPLPSTRTLSETLGVARNTVRVAYATLAAQGVVAKGLRRHHVA